MTINKILSYSIISLLFLTLFTPLVVSTSLFFPFIVGKALFFRVIVEIAFALYIILAIRDRSYIPKKSFIFWTVMVFIGIMGIATFNSEYSYKSFWSNFERMEGYVSLLHMLAFFLTASAVINSKKAWSWFFNTSLAISVIIGLYGLSGAAGHPAGYRIDGTLGNSSYLGIYALLHMFIAGFFIMRTLRENRKGQTSFWYIISTYSLLVIWNGYILFYTGTRGSLVGLIVGLGLISLIVSIWERKHKAIRITGISVLVLMLAGVVFLGAIKGTSFAKSHNLLDRYSNIIPTSLTDAGNILHTEGFARINLWAVAFQGVKERPILGWGQESFNYVFAKYYDPGLYNQEQWFDRTHDVFLDWLIAGGFLGLIGYLSLFVALLVLIWKRGKENESTNGEIANEWGVGERALLTGMLAAYFVHNLFVFDNLTSYILFFSILAFIHNRSTSELSHESKSNKNHLPLISDLSAQWAVIVVVTVVLISTLYIVVIKTYKTGETLIKALQYYQIGEKQNSVDTISASYNYFNEALAYDNLGSSEIREQIMTYAVSAINNKIVPVDLKQKFYQLAVSELKTQTELSPNDARYYYFLGTFYAQVGQYKEAESTLSKAVSLSPTKQSFIEQLGIIYLVQKDTVNALAEFKKAYDLLPDHSDKNSEALYIAGLIYNGKINDANKLIKETGNYDEKIVTAFVDMKLYQNVLDFRKTKFELEPTNGQNAVSLAAAYLKVGDSQGAIATIRKVIATYPAFKEKGESLITQIQEGKDPTEGGANPNLTN